MEDRAPGDRGPRRVEVPGLSPVRAFFVVGALAAIPLALLATRSAEPSTSPEPARQSPSYELTEAEAIAEFERLNARRIRAYRSRDLSLLHEVVAADSPLFRRGESEIRQLLTQGVVVKSRFVTEKLDVVERTGDEIMLLQTEADYPRFFAEDGANVTGDAVPRRRVIEWTLRREGTRWWIYDSRLISERRVR